MPRRRSKHREEEQGDERWLLTYADMITLLMALFMVLFSISAVNKSKFEVLSESLEEAFSGKVLPGGQAIKQSGSSTETKNPTPKPPIPAVQPILEKLEEQSRRSSAQTEQDDFKRLKRQIDDYARRQGLQKQVETRIARRGLVIRLLTDRVLFDSGRADLKPASRPVLDRVARLLRVGRARPIMVEGHTDNVPLHGGRFPTNWELSTARAARVVRFLAEDGVAMRRLGATGYGWLHPISTNRTADGRSRNRRVEIVLMRGEAKP